jgi:hypothetical protein
MPHVSAPADSACRLRKQERVDGERHGRPCGCAGTRARLRAKQGLLGTLLERAADTNAYTRARCLQTWGHLAQANAIPLGHWLAVTELAIGARQIWPPCLALRMLNCQQCCAAHARSLPSSYREISAGSQHASLLMHASRLQLHRPTNAQSWQGGLSITVVSTSSAAKLTNSYACPGRLEDKSSIVRRAALGLLGALLSHNPFGEKLPEAAFAASLAEYRAKLQARVVRFVSVCHVARCLISMPGNSS